MREGPANPNWRGGRVVEPRGYVLIRVGKDHPLADVRGYAYEHRLVAAAAGEDVAGRDVHHVDETPGHNKVSNLEALTRAEHRVAHRKNEAGLRMPGEENPTVSCACGCGAAFLKFDGAGRPRRFMSGHNPRPATTRDAVLAVLSHGPLHRAAVAVALATSGHAVATALSKLKRDGLVVSDGRGKWRRCG
jgi:predicted Rossmann fold nucleotide-binding protein DprA/Smf involved in DNA uptake